MLKRLAAGTLAALLALAALWPGEASRFEPVTNAQLAAGFSSCQGSGAVGTTFQVTGTNAFGCAASTPGTGALRYDTSQSLTTTQQDQTRANILGPVPTSPSSSATLATTDIERPFYPTAALTLTMPNGGSGWLSGPIVNSTALTSLVTLAVPSGATLDGTTNGTTTLYPFQKARVIQTGSTAYVTDWLDRTPIVGTKVITASTASFALTLPAGYSRFEIVGTDLYTDTSSASLITRLSFDGGSTYKTGTSDYSGELLEGAGSSTSATSYSQSYNFITDGSNGTAGLTNDFDGKLSPGTATYTSRWRGSYGGYMNGQNRSGQAASYGNSVYGRATTVLFLMTSGNVTNLNLSIRGLVP